MASKYHILFANKASWVYACRMRVIILAVLALCACNNGARNVSDPAPTAALPEPWKRASPLTGPFEFKTDAPKRLDRFIALPVSSAEEYREAIVPLKDRLVSIRVPPTEVRVPALYGFNVVFDGENHSFIVDGDAQRGYRLFIDLNGDGNLQNDRPRHFIAGEGPPTVVLEPTAEERGRAIGTVPELIIVFEIRAPRDGSILPFSVWRSDQTLRRGTAKLGGREYAFALLGENGVYNRDYQGIIVDIDGDGQLNLTEEPLSPERYSIRERYMHLGGHGYEFQVASDGSTLTLTPITFEQPPRPDVRPSFPAPPMRLPDFSGRLRDTLEFQGKWILLDFWAPWCQPCVRAAPELARTRRELGPSGLEIIGVHDGEPDEVAREFVRDRAMWWPQLIDADRAAQAIYRVDDLPTYVLIDPAGTIVARENAWSAMRAVLDRNLLK